MRFEPIAIIGRSCILPGALDPESLWEAVLEGRDLLSTVPEGYWQLRPESVRVSSPSAAQDRTWSDRGGYVRGFERVFDPKSYANIPAEDLLALDPIFHWVLHGLRQALTDAGIKTPVLPRDQNPIGLVLGNLAYPTSSLTRLAEHRWYENQGERLCEGQAARLAGLEEPDPRNRFCSGYPAHFAVEALGLGGEAFALDAACASSLYAIKLACDRLHDRDAEVMVAGAVNRADDLFLHVGFCTLQAMSQSGQSRPFERAADGLVPAEGAAFVVLKRLEDAVAADDRIFGVIRGVGLCNDGRRGGFLVPAEEGQLRAMRQAYETAGVDPASISLLECHATGTPIGDAVEIRSAAQIFSEAKDLPIGSLKSNLGHLITTAGLAGLIKVLGAMQAGLRPPSINVEAPISGIEGAPLRLLRASEPWDVEGPRRAAVSAFGFGGNNAHLIVEEWDPEHAAASARTPSLDTNDAPIAIVALESAVGGDLLDGLLGGKDVHRIEHIALELSGLRFPPRDLEQTLPQQLLIMELARRAVSRVGSLPADATAVLIGMGCDAEIARYAARWRLSDRSHLWQEAGFLANPEWVKEAQDAFVHGLEAAGVVGTMPNILANRLNTQLDLRGPSFTVAAEELSGLRALELAERALRRGEIDAALVGAVDLSCEPVHAEAARRVLESDRMEPGDAAVVLVLKRLADAERHGDAVLALLDREGDGDMRLGLASGSISLNDRFGHAHAASGLLHVAAAVHALKERIRIPEPGALATPWLSTEPRRARIEVEALGGQRVVMGLRESPGNRPSGLLTPPLLEIYCGEDAAAVLADLERGKTSNHGGPARLSITARHEDALAPARERAKHYLRGVPAPGFRTVAPGVYWCGAPLEGDLAFVFTGAATAYGGMGRELLLALPELGDRVLARFPSLASVADWLRHEDLTLLKDPFRMLQGSTLLCQLHAILSRELLGIQSPAAVLGVSSGETNSVLAMGAWADLDALFREIRDSGMYSHWISGDFRCARRAWGLDGNAEIDWTSWRVLATCEQIERALHGEPCVRLTMINAPADCVIAGRTDDCKRVLERLGGKTAVRMGYDVIAHCPELATWKHAWHAIHHRQTKPMPGLRFYSNASGSFYEAGADAIAKALTNQAIDRVDFRRVVEAAWKDGVRVFIEHGPRGLCSAWIDAILGEREHLSVALDRPRDGLGQLFDSLARLVAAGVPLQLDAFCGRFRKDNNAPSPKRILELPAHAPEVVLPSLRRDIMTVSSGNGAGPQVMAPAPWLPPIMDLPERPMAAPAMLAEVPSTALDATPPATPPAPAPAASTPALLPARALSSDDRRAAIVERMKQLHAKVSQAHQQFLSLQERAIDRVLALRRAVDSQLPSGRRRSFSLPVPATHAALFSSALPVPPALPGSKTPPVTLPADLRALKPGPKLSREDLEVLASDRISRVLGPLFEPQDTFRRQVRMPEPPLLLADRVTGISGEAGTLGKGSIWTETDVRPESWYLHQGRMPAGIMIEAGQADLLLISWLGIDFENRGERVYRLLGCELTYRGALPEIGDTLSYDIHLDSYTQQGRVRLFFFHYDCWVGDEVRLSVRHGQAGFFTDQELADSAGVLWDAESSAPREGVRVDPPAIDLGRRAFSAVEVRAFSEARVTACFGANFRTAQSHVRTPRIQPGRMLLFDEVTDFNARGGAWGRGYLRAVKHLDDDEWFFNGHFKDDPCMPGTLMFEGCLQTMAFYMAALGLTLDKDGWRFEPVSEEPYTLRCRGQVVPGARRLVYEVFVEELVAGPVPLLVADLLCTVDGLKALHCRGMRLQLAPALPLESRVALLPIEAQPERCAQPNGHVFDFASLTACAWGRPSDAFGPMYRTFDGTRRCPRLPGPPYLFMTRITRIEAEAATMQPGGRIEVEYDIPEEAWYFSENGRRSMPFCVLLEAALQPCGWLASYVGCALSASEDLFFRNLDGTGILHAELPPGAGTLRSRVLNKSISRAGTVIIVGFEVECFLDDLRVYSMDTVFGFFPEAILANQVGLPASPAEQAALDQTGKGRMSLEARPAAYFSGELRLPGPMLFLLNRVTLLDTEGGTAGLGQARAEIDIDPDQWYFKSHFFQDPVQPGSLGIEAMIQLLQLFMLHARMGEGIARPRFEPLALGRALTWKYRGQVLPHHKRVSIDLEITERARDADGALAVARFSYWVDGMKIYEAAELGIRIASDTSERRADEDEILDPAVEPWLRDHCPTWTIPALPMMSMVDRLAAAAQARTPGRRVAGLRNVRVARWLGFADGARRLKVLGSPRGEDRVECRLLAWEEATARYELVASGEVLLSEDCAFGGRCTTAPATAALEGALQPDPYEAGWLPHGPRYQALLELRFSERGSSVRLDADPGEVPFGALNQRLLDAATHGIPHDRLHLWCDEIPTDMVGYPVSIPQARFYRPAPRCGTLRCEARFVGFAGGSRFPSFELRLIEGEQIWAEITLVEALFPKGPLGMPEARVRRAFLRDQVFIPGLSLSRYEGNQTALHPDEVHSSDWLSGTLAQAYATEARGGEALTQELAIKEHAARHWEIHPARVRVEGLEARSTALPLSRLTVALRRRPDGEFRVASAVSATRLDLSPLRDFWRTALGLGLWLGEDLFLGLVERFVESVRVTAPEALAALSGRGALFLGNHQVGVESVLFGIISSGLFGLPTAVFAKAEHRDSWIGRLLGLCFSRPGLIPPELMVLIGREDQQEVLRAIRTSLEEVRAGGKGLLIHSEGTRALQARQPVNVLSTTVIDLAVGLGLPIVPVRFAGGLPLEPLPARLEFPVGYGRQEIWIGCPMAPEELRGLASPERQALVLGALNRLGDVLEREQPLAGDPTFAARVRRRMEEWCVDETQAVLACVLEDTACESEEGRRVLEAMAKGTLLQGDSPEAVWLRTCAEGLFGLR